MRTKSAYRVKAYRDGGRVLADDVIPTPLKVPSDAPRSDGGVVGEASASQGDDASVAFVGQIDALHRAEEAQRLRSKSPPPQSPRSAKLEQLRREGLSEKAISFFAANPDILDTPQLADQAARAARDEGHEVDSPGFFQAVKSNYHRITEQSEPEPSEALEIALKYTGGANGGVSLRDTANLERDQFHRSAAMVSAPVSREVPSSSGSREDRGPTRITLSVAEREHARLSGTSELDYARGKLELERRKRDGEI